MTALSPTLVQADPVLLERAVSNLLDNAVKYSPAGAPIEVSVRGGEVVVRTTARASREEDLPRIFDRFYRAAAARSKPGAGPRPRDRARGGRGARRHGDGRDAPRRRPLHARPPGADRR